MSEWLSLASRRLPSFSSHNEKDSFNQECSLSPQLKTGWWRVE